MKRVVVTGGAGFIGSHLCERLVGEGFFVTCVDNLITGSEKNIEALKGSDNFRFEKLDITWEWKNLGDIDYIFHLASPASPIDYQKHPEETAEVNSMGTIGLLKQARSHSAKFLLASTSEVYGDPNVSPQKEDYWGNVNSFGPRSCYDESKRFAETMTYIYIQKYEVDARIVRIFNTYGPKMQKDDGRVVSNFINQAINGEDITVYGDGLQTRSFCYISDMVEGIYKAMFADNTKSEVINLGNPDEFTMLDLAQKIKTMTDSQSKIVFKDLPQDDPKQRRPDISKAGSLLDWKPVVSVEMGLEKTISYYKSIQ